jgi:hypothetical protein
VPQRIELVFERNTYCKHSFQGGERVILFKIGLSSKVEETHVFLKRQPHVLEAGESSTLFPVRIELVVERNTSCKSQASRWKKTHFVPNSPIQLS